eukprot:7233332-Prymnesium_polylepis.2
MIKLLPTAAKAVCMLTTLPSKPPNAGPHAMPALRACDMSAMLRVRLSGVPVLTTPAMTEATIPESATPPISRHATSSWRLSTRETLPREAPINTRLPIKILLLPFFATISVAGMLQTTLLRKKAPFAAPNPAAVMPRCCTSCGSKGVRMPKGSAVRAIPAAR